MSAQHPQPDSDERFVLYVEGPRDRSLLEAWARSVSPPLARALPEVSVILGGCQPARAVEHLRALRERHGAARGLCVLDRDLDPGRAPVHEAEPGLDVFTWGRRHIESYLLVPAAIHRSARLARDDTRVARFFRQQLPAVDDEATLAGFDAKPLFAHHGAFQRLLGRPLRPVQVARAMRPEELHADVHGLLARVAHELGLRAPAPAVHRRALRS